MYSTQTNPPAIIREYFTEKPMQVIREFKVPYAKTSMELIMDYMLKQISAIDKAREELRKEYPNFLPSLCQ